jgi:hypothetical protein
MAVLSIALIWRLQSGPISLNSLTPYIERALNSDGARYEIAIGETVLIWAGWGRTFDVRMLNVQASDTDGRSIIQVPEIGVSFSLPALLRGIIAPKSIEVFRPELHLVRDIGGQFALDLGEDVLSHGNLLERIAGIIASAPSPSNPISYLERFDLIKAQLLLEDVSKGWSMRMPVTYLNIKRDESGSKMEATLNVPLGGTVADIFVRAAYLDGKGVTTTIQFDDVSPRALAYAVTPLQQLAAVDAAVSGTLKIGLTKDGSVERMRLEVSAATGTLHLPEAGIGGLAFRQLAGQVELEDDGSWFGNAEFLPKDSDNSGRLTLAVTGGRVGGRSDVVLRLDGVSPSALAGAFPDGGLIALADVPLTGTVTASFAEDGLFEDIGFDLSGGAGRFQLPLPASQPKAVSAMLLRGHVAGTFDRIDLEAFSVEFPDNTFIPFPGSVGDAVPLRSLSFSGSYDAVEDKLVVVEMEADLGGPSAEISGMASGLGGSADIFFNGVLLNFPIDDLEQYWPTDWGKDARAWVDRHMSVGILSRVAAKVHVRGNDGGGFDVLSIVGDFDVNNATVSYLGDLTPATGVKAQAQFSRKKIVFNIEEGAVGDLELASGTIALTDIDAYDSFGDFEFFVNGPLNSVMLLLDKEPLGFSSILGISPIKSVGWSTTRLHLFTILENDLSLDEVEIDATSELRDVFIEKAVLGLDISSENLLLKVDKKGMDVYGRILLGTMPGVLNWRENFTDGAPFRSLYGISGSLTENQRTEELGLNFPPFSSNLIKGPINTVVHHTVYQDGRGVLDAKIDLMQASVDLSSLRWKKASGIPGMADISLEIHDEKITAVPRFSVAADDLSIAGSATFVDGGEYLDYLYFDDIRYGRTELSGLLTRRPDGGWEADFKGSSFDMSTMLGDALTDRPDASTGYDGPPLSLSANVQTVWLGPDRQLNQVAGTLVSNGALWSVINMKGQFSEGHEFQVHLEPAGPERRRLTIHSGDAGAALRGLGLYGNMTGGMLDISGEYDDSKLGSPLAGNIAVNDFRIVRAPVLVQLLSIMALTGVLDVLEGEGLVFDDLEAPFVLHNGVMSIEQGRASGRSIGFTSSGTIDTRGDNLDLVGTVVPAYIINSALGWLPLVGDLFTGGEKGGGIFAANYSMRGQAENPSIKVNPLSALAPGFLRRLFGIFDEEHHSPDPPEDLPTAGGFPETRLVP